VKRVAAIVLGFGLVGCAGGPPSVRYSDGFMREVRETANPSTVVATEIAFARAVREDGQAAAMRQYLAGGGVIHDRGGVVDAGGWIAAQAAIPAPHQWTPLAIWSSCDGQLAISQGKYVGPDREWGFYVTVWERERNGSYRWSYTTGAPDAALTQRETRAAAPPAEEDESVIVVQAIPMIQGPVADCRTGDDTSSPAASAIADETASGGGVSDDGSLAWRWVQRADGGRSVAAQQWQGGQWESAFDFVVTPDGRVDPQ